MIFFNIFEKVLSRKKSKATKYKQISNDLPKKTVSAYPPSQEGITTDDVEDILLSQNDLIKSIQKKLGIAINDWDQYVYPVIRNYASYVHQLPASQCDHHCGLGGLFFHGLEVGDTAIRYSEDCLPYLGKDPSIKKLYETKWRVAVFIGALLHDVAKPATDVIVTDKNGKNEWSAYAETLESWYHRLNLSEYYFTYIVKRGMAHEIQTQNIALSLIIPKTTLAYLSSNGTKEIITKLYASLAKDTETNKEITDIVIRADSYSSSIDQKPFGELNSVAKGTPLDNYFIFLVREMLDEKGKWQINSQNIIKSLFVLSQNGNLYMIWERYVFSEFYNLAEKAELRGIPRNINTIADYLIDHKLCEAYSPTSRYYQLVNTEKYGIEKLLSLAGIDTISSNDQHDNMEEIQDIESSEIKTEEIDELSILESMLDTVKQISKSPGDIDDIPEKSNIEIESSQENEACMSENAEIADLATVQVLKFAKKGYVLNGLILDYEPQILFFVNEDNSLLTDGDIERYVKQEEPEKYQIETIEHTPQTDTQITQINIEAPLSETKEQDDSTTPINDQSQPQQEQRDIQSNICKLEIDTSNEMVLLNGRQITRKQLEQERQKLNENEIFFEAEHLFVNGEKKCVAYRTIKKIKKEVSSQDLDIAVVTGKKKKKKTYLTREEARNQLEITAPTERIDYLARLKEVCLDELSVNLFAPLLEGEHKIQSNMLKTDGEYFGLAISQISESKLYVASLKCATNKQIMEWCSNQNVTVPDIYSPTPFTTINNEDCLRFNDEINTALSLVPKFIINPLKENPPITLDKENSEEEFSEFDPMVPFIETTDNSKQPPFASEKQIIESSGIDFSSNEISNIDKAEQKYDIVLNDLADQLAQHGGRYVFNVIETDEAFAGDVRTDSWDQIATRIRAEYPDITQTQLNKRFRTFKPTGFRYFKKKRNGDGVELMLMKEPITEKSIKEY